jgi:hypothetical protein
LKPLDWIGPSEFFSWDISLVDEFKPLWGEKIFGYLRLIKAFA